MSLNNEYAKLMGNGVDSLVENHNYNKATNHVTFDAEKVELPKGITPESLQAHVGFINNTSGQVREATAVIARNEYANNNKLTTVDGTLDLHGVVFNSQHHLKQTIGEDAHLYGHSTTQVTYHHSEDHANWMAEQDRVNVDMATKLFS
jgi:hypothetical protein